ncbi:MAG: carboxypeptidase regulatory-like domain-containing protein [Candidatus Omnitrophota bacterium]
MKTIIKNSKIFTIFIVTAMAFLIMSSHAFSYDPNDLFWYGNDMHPQQNKDNLNLYPDDYTPEGEPWREISYEYGYYDENRERDEYGRIEVDQYGFGYGHDNLPDDEPCYYLWPLRETERRGLNCPKAWDLWVRGKGIVTAVIDSGAYIDHPDLVQADGRSAILEYRPGEFAVKNFITGTTDVTDNLGQGTAIAGIIAAGMNNWGAQTGCIGVAPESKLMILKVIDHPTLNNDLNNTKSLEDLVEEAIYYAAGRRDDGSGVPPEHIADIINIGVRVNPTVGIKEALKYANSLGCIIVAPAGGDLAALDGVIGVGATYHDGTHLGEDKKTGTKIQGASVYAPGIEIVSLCPPRGSGEPGKPTFDELVKALPNRRQIFEFQRYDYGHYFHLMPYIQKEDGHALAAAHISGVIALIQEYKETIDKGDLWGVVKKYTPEEIETLLKFAAVEKGIPDIRKALDLVGSRAVIPIAKIVLDNKGSFRGTIDIKGILKGNPGSTYVLEYVNNDPSKGVQGVITDGSLASEEIKELYLGKLDTAKLEDGSYTLRLYLHTSIMALKDEVVININNSCLEGWPIVLKGAEGNYIGLSALGLGSPTIADLNNDSKKEVILIGNINERGIIDIRDYKGERFNCMPESKDEYAWKEYGPITASDGSSDDNFGISVFMDAQFAVVGAPKDGRGLYSGSAYILRNNYSSGWAEEKKLIPIDGAGGDRFGISVAGARLVTTERVIIGAGNSGGKGAAYIFRNDSKTWPQERKLIAPNGRPGDMFGKSVAMDITNFEFSMLGEHNRLRAVVGAPWSEGRSLQTGSVYIFVRDDFIWNPAPEQILTAEDGEERDEFGEAVSMYEDVILVGAPSKSNGKGAAYIYRYSLETRKWEYEQKLTITNGEDGDKFGCSVALEKDYAVIGAWGRNNDKGAVYVYKYDANMKTWGQEPEQVLELEGLSSQARFGNSVSITRDPSDENRTSDRIVVGSNSMEGKSNSVYVHKYYGSKWELEGALRPKDNEPSFGIYVSIYGQNIITSAVNKDVNKGAAYMFGYSKKEPEVKVFGWPKMNRLFHSKALAYDLDNDSDLEILAATGDEAYAWNIDGTGVAGWPFREGRYLSPITISDLDNDERPEIITAGVDENNIPTIYALNPDGTLKASIMRRAGDTLEFYSLNTPPSIADLDGKGAKEITTLSSYNGIGTPCVRVFSESGMLWKDKFDIAPANFGVTDNIEGADYIQNYLTQSMIGNVDNTKELEVIVTGYIVFYKTSSRLVEYPDQYTGDFVRCYRHDGEIKWTRFIESGKNNTTHDYNISSMGDIDEDGCADIVFISSNGNMYLLGGSDGSAIKKIVPKKETDQFHSSTVADSKIIAATKNNEIKLYDFKGDLIKVLSMQPGTINEGMMPFSLKSPALGDLDNDNKLDIVAPTYSLVEESFDKIYAFTLEESKYDPNTVEWGSYQNEGNTGLHNQTNYMALNIPNRTVSVGEEVNINFADHLSCFPVDMKVEFSAESELIPPGIVSAPSFIWTPLEENEGKTYPVIARAKEINGKLGTACTFNITVKTNRLAIHGMVYDGYLVGIEGMDVYLRELDSDGNVINSKSTYSWIDGSYKMTNFIKPGNKIQVRVPDLVIGGETIYTEATVTRDINEVNYVHSIDVYLKRAKDDKGYDILYSNLLGTVVDESGKTIGGATCTIKLGSNTITICSTKNSTSNVMYYWRDSSNNVQRKTVPQNFYIRGLKLETMYNISFEKEGYETVELSRASGREEYQMLLAPIVMKLVSGNDEKGETTQSEKTQRITGDIKGYAKSFIQAQEFTPSFFPISGIKMRAVKCRYNKEVKEEDAYSEITTTDEKGFYKFEGLVWDQVLNNDETVNKGKSDWYLITANYDRDNKVYPEYNSVTLDASGGVQLGSKITEPLLPNETQDFSFKPIDDGNNQYFVCFGRVLDSTTGADGLGLANITFKVNGLQGATSYSATTFTYTKESDYRNQYKIQGWFFIPAVPVVKGLDQYTVEISKDGYKTKEGNKSYKDDDMIVDPKHAKADGFKISGPDKGNVTLYPAPKYTISGTVTDDKEDALEEVTVIAKDKNNETYSDTTGSDGTYTIGDLSEGDYTVTAGTSEGYKSPESKSVTLDGDKDNINFTFIKLSTISGKVLDTYDKKSISNAILELKSKDADWTTGTTSGSDGSYELSNVPKGAYTLTASKPNSPYSKEDVSIDLNIEGNVTQDVLLKAFIDFDIMITDKETGTAIMGANVTVDGKPVGTTDSLGLCRANAEKGEHELSASKDNYISNSMSIKIIEPVTITALKLLSNAPRIFGKVLDPDGNPIGGVMITIRTPDRKVIRCGTNSSGLYDSGTMTLKGKYQVIFTPLQKYYNRTSKVLEINERTELNVDIPWKETKMRIVIQDEDGKRIRQDFTLEANSKEGWKLNANGKRGNYLAIVRYAKDEDTLYTFNVKGVDGYQDGKNTLLGKDIRFFRTLYITLEK